MVLWNQILPLGKRTRANWFRRFAQHSIVFPAVALLVLGIIWSITANLITIERATAQRAVVASTLELLDTYEAQMVRNLREIDQTLKLVKYAYEAAGDPSVLVGLKQKGLLLPDLLFVVTIADSEGRILSSTRPAERQDVTHTDSAQPPSSDELGISRPRQNARTGEWGLVFSRRLNPRPGEFAGVVTVRVGVPYLVSGYERTKLGDYGVLGLVGAHDGIFRVRRSGNVVMSGESANDLLLKATSSTDDASVVRAASAWDGVMRLTSVRPLYGFALTLVVGLSEDEQLAAIHGNARAYIVRAALASAVLLLLIGLLGRVSWKLTQAARREDDATLAHAERVQFLAYRDALTSLPNRAFFSKMLEHGISEARRYERSVAVLFLDLDRFKQINDTLGHAAGDRLLQEIANRLKSCLRDSDTVARLGGDEFVVLLPSFDDEKYVATVAQKLLSVVAQPFALLGQNLIGTTSVGIALYPRDGEDEQTLMKHADAAMYHAKSEGKNNFQFYSQRLQVNSLKRLSLESSLRQALERGEFRLHYQPKIDLYTNRISGVEALLRWRSADHGMVSPADFIPIAEDTGLIVAIGQWVLETACMQNIAWQKQGLPNICVAVNLSARQFGDEHLLDDVTAILNRTGLDPNLLELEITESMLMHNVEKAIRTLKTLSEMGVRIAMDDFGTGYSSLANLKRFPLNTLKIDRSFISALPDDAEDRVITQAIIGMGKALSLSVVAEGVETAAQAEFLRAHGCDEYQGYHYSKPVSAGEAQVLLEVQQARDVSVTSLISSQAPQTTGHPN